MLQHYCNLTIWLFSVIQDTCWEGSYPSAEVQLVYSTVPADRQYTELNVKTVKFQIIQFSIRTQFR